MHRLQLIRATGILLILLIILSNIPYILLIQTFGYDDILREPVDVVLTMFQAGGTGLIFIWFGFGLAALMLIPVSFLLQSVLALPANRHQFPYLPMAALLGVLSGVLQAIGLMRWVFVIPVLANLYTDPQASVATREAVSIVYRAVHQYGGVVIGEHLGQLLLIGWTLGLGWAMRSSVLFKSWIAWWGIFTTPLLLLGQSELLATVVPNLPVLETTPIGFILWEVWLLVVGVYLIKMPRKRILLKEIKGSL
ncbi:DUF4386 domain-containing protein [Almyronema epifaneia]|uniref:DUF4386 domain-containing protein n=1 Tax=Almyronema epifaneia S1 TaxID=2991925 RepID=A0ABW6IJY8_9CYAN